MSKITKATELNITPQYTKSNPLPIENVLAYRKKGLTQKDIAKLLGTTRETVSRKLAQADVEIKELNFFKAHRADSFAKLEQMLLNSITPDEVKRMAIDRRVWCLGVLYDKERMERGQSTVNVSIQSTVEHYAQKLDDASKTLEELAA